jgi:hypothetical protein
MKDYKVIAKLGEEVFNLVADTEEEAFAIARNTIAEDYGRDFANYAEYIIEEVKS